MIVEDIKEQTGGYTKSSAWYVNALESALADLQVEDSDTIDTGGITLGSLFFFSYSVAYPEKYPFLGCSTISSSPKIRRRWVLRM